MMPLVLWLPLAGAAAEVSLDVPFAAQEKNGCGAASIAMVMQYWRPGAEIDARAIHRELSSDRARGVYASELQRYARSRGFRTFAFRGEWADVENHLRKGRPLIVALKAGGDDLHYVVATGFDSEKDLVIKHDPAGRKLMKQHRGEFESQWRGAGNWTLLVLPE